MAVSRSLKILCIDDEEGLIEVLMDYFEGLGHTVDCALGGHQATLMTKENSYDLIVSDVQMPDGDGVEFIKSLRAYSETPLIFISGYTDFSEEKLIQFGANCLLTKPFSFEILEEEIEKIFGE